MGQQSSEQERRETRRLYFEDAYQKEFEATVVDRFSFEGKPALILDQTCFYPESGGQPHDRGQINGIEVTHVFEDGPRVVHVLAGEVKGEKAHGVIDWPRRFDHMQQHSGQHILSQSFYELLRGETCSFHLGEEVSTLEIGLREISEEGLRRVESRANAVVFENKEIKTYFVPQDEIASIPLRRPPKKEGLIRVVEVEGYDYSACGGTHCRRTGEIGLIKIIRWERIRGNLRFEFLCGRRAVEDYAWKTKALVEVATKLSSHERDVPSAVEKNLAETKQLRKKMRQLQEKLVAFEAGEIARNPAGKIITSVLKDKTPDEARLLALHVIKLGEFAVLYGVEGETRSHLIFARSDALPMDMRDLMPSVLERTKGKGGGNSSLVEIVVDKGADLEALLKSAGEALVQKIEAHSR